MNRTALRLDLGSTWATLHLFYEQRLPALQAVLVSRQSNRDSLAQPSDRARTSRSPAYARISAYIETQVVKPCFPPLPAQEFVSSSKLDLPATIHRNMATVREEAAMSDLPNIYMRNQHEYTYRLPTPPRIVVPPPTLAADMPGLALGDSLGEDVDMSFLNELDLENIVQKNTLLEWAYERRRQAQMILPWLYLGPMVAAKDKAFLEREGITMVLAVRAQSNSLMGAMQAASQVCLEVTSIEAPSFYALTPDFPRATRMINAHVAKVRQHTLQAKGEAALGKVLVFCESGNEKSAAVVAAYLMETMNNFDHIKAMQMCQAQRFCVNFDDTLKNILRSYWDIVGARRAIAASQYQALHQNGQSDAHSRRGPLSLASSLLKQKRGLEEMRDEDASMDEGIEASDALRFADRDVTPFQDR